MTPEQLVKHDLTIKAVKFLEDTKNYNYPLEFGLTPDSVINWTGECKEDHPTQAEIDAELIRLQAEYDAQEYARSRDAEYPSLKDQQDMQFHDAIDGTTTWQDAIQAIKDKYPKPE